jgi:2-dehydropantoate 2-reductase
MMAKLSNERIAVVGAGAVGCYFGGMLARAGATVTFLRRPPGDRSGAARTLGPLYIDSVHFQESVRVQWAGEPGSVRDAEIVLFCVKAIDNESAARQIAAHLQPGAIVVSLQNGVDNAEQIHAASGVDALPSVVYVAAAMAGPDRVQHNGRGDLVIGEFQNRRRVPESGKSGAAPGPSRVERVAALFQAAGVPCAVSANIEADLWTKLMMNCAGNAITALGRASYGRVAAHEPSRKVIADVVSECLAVARAAGVHLPERDYVSGGIQLAATLGEATSSTAQDIARGKRTEIDSLNGYVARLGGRLGVATPVNATLHALVKLLEESK